jgi:hypothetical protein
MFATDVEPEVRSAPFARRDQPRGSDGSGGRIEPVIDIEDLHRGR